jgi:hypothetical protein
MTKVIARTGPWSVSTVIHRGMLLGGFSTAKELAELRLEISVGKPVENSSTLAAPVERHHETGLLCRSPPTGLPEARGPVPPTSGPGSLLDVLKLRLPDQRTIGEKPYWIARALG